MLDTQILIRSFLGKMELPDVDRAISSVTANEFLISYDTTHAAQNYYLPIVSDCHEGDSPAEGSGAARRDHPFPKRRTDQTLFDFNAKYDSFIYYGNIAVAEAINGRKSFLFQTTVSILEKQLRKDLGRRFSYLLDNHFTCLPFGRQSTATAFELLSAFEKRHNPKNDFRNTFSDFLILSSAKEYSDNLLTEDTLLRRFSAEYFGAGFYLANDGAAKMEFNSLLTGKQVTRESKGYVNRGWRASFRNYRPFSDLPRKL